MLVMPVVAPDATYISNPYASNRISMLPLLVKQNQSKFTKTHQLNQLVRNKMKQMVRSVEFSNLVMNPKMLVWSLIIWNHVYDVGTPVHVLHLGDPAVSEVFHHTRAAKVFHRSGALPQLSRDRQYVVGDFPPKFAPRVSVWRDTKPVSLITAEGPLITSELLGQHLANLSTGGSIIVRVSLTHMNKNWVEELTHGVAMRFERCSLEIPSDGFFNDVFLVGEAYHGKDLTSLPVDQDGGSERWSERWCFLVDSALTELNDTIDAWKRNEGRLRQFLDEQG